MSLDFQANAEQVYLYNAVMPLIKNNNFFNVGDIMAQNNKQAQVAIRRCFDSLIRLDLFQRALGVSIDRTSHELFIDGMKHYFDVDFGGAANSWLEAGRQAEKGESRWKAIGKYLGIGQRDGDPIRAVSYYWAGHLQNNIGLYSQAEENFEKRGKLPKI